MSFRGRLQVAYTTALDRGLSPIRVAITPGDWPVDFGLPVVGRLAKGSPISVLWARSPDGTREIPFPLAPETA